MNKTMKIKSKTMRNIYMLNLTLIYTQLSKNQNKDIHIKEMKITYKNKIDYYDDKNSQT